jgi:hypothetical protein
MATAAGQRQRADLRHVGHCVRTPVNRSWLPIRQWRVFGATVHVHFLVLIATGLLLVLAVRNIALAMAAVISYLAIIFVHEFGHAAVAHWLGHDVNAIYVGGRAMVRKVMRGVSKLE